MSAYVESAASAVQTTVSSSTQGMTQMSETASFAVAGGTSNTNVERKTSVALEKDAGKPVFIKTIEGFSAERK